MPSSSPPAPIEPGGDGVAALSKSWSVFQGSAPALSSGGNEKSSNKKSAKSNKKSSSQRKLPTPDNEDSRHESSPSLSKKDDLKPNGSFRKERMEESISKNQNQQLSSDKNEKKNAVSCSRSRRGSKDGNNYNTARASRSRSKHQKDLEPDEAPEKGRIKYRRHKSLESSEKVGRLIQKSNSMRVTRGEADEAKEVQFNESFHLLPPRFEAWGDDPEAIFAEDVKVERRRSADHTQTTFTTECDVKQGKVSRGEKKSRERNPQTPKRTYQEKVNGFLMPPCADDAEPINPWASKTPKPSPPPSVSTEGAVKNVMVNPWAVVTPVSCSHHYQQTPKENPGPSITSEGAVLLSADKKISPKDNNGKKRDREDEKGKRKGSKSEKSPAIEGKSPGESSVNLKVKTVERKLERKAPAFLPRTDSNPGRTNSGDAPPNGVSGVSEQPRQRVDYYRNPTLLSRLIQFQRFESAIARLEKYPHEAGIWLVAKRQRNSGPPPLFENRVSPSLSHKTTRSGPPNAPPWLERSPAPSSQSSAANDKDDDGYIALEQLPLHMAGQQLAVHCQSPLLTELLTQLILIYPEACEYPDHAGMYCIHYLIQYQAPPELVSLALVAHPPSCAIRSPTGRNLKQIFYLTWNEHYGLYQRDSSNALVAESLESIRSTMGGGTGVPATSVLDRLRQRQQDQIAQLLEYDVSFWESAKRESAAMRQIQTSWKQQSNKSTKTRSGPPTPWMMLQERQDETERTVDETSCEGDTDQESLLKAPSGPSNVEEDSEIQAMSWSLLEQRVSWMEQMLFQTQDANYELAIKNDALSSKSLRKEESSGLQRTELARQAYELRKENEKLKQELRSAKFTVGLQQRGAATDFDAEKDAEPYLAEKMISDVNIYQDSTPPVATPVQDNQRDDESLSFNDLFEDEGEEEQDDIHDEDYGDPRDDRHPAGPPPLMSYRNAVEKEKPGTSPAQHRHCESPASPVRQGKDMNKNDYGGQPTPGEMLQRETNRLIHKEYRDLANRYRAQEEVVRRLEAMIDALLRSKDWKDSKKSREPKFSLARQERERRQAFSWVPRGVFLPETDNLESILEYASNQEEQVLSESESSEHKRRWTPNPEDIRPKKPLPKHPSEFHFDIELPSFVKDKCDGDNEEDMPTHDSEGCPSKEEWLEESACSMSLQSNGGIEIKGMHQVRC